MRRIGLLGGSFNPAHEGHRQLSLAAIEALGLDELWWLVSPGNPLKAGAGDMAPYEARLASSHAMAAGTPIRLGRSRPASGQAQRLSTGRGPSHAGRVREPPLAPMPRAA